MSQSEFDSIKIQLASPQQIRKWAYRVLPTGERVGEVTQPETLNYRTHQPEISGLFCERIFGPIRDWECRCGKYKLNSQTSKKTYFVCESCGVEVTKSKIRRYRIGCIELAAPIVHIWYFKSRPSYISYLLGIKLEYIENTVYFVHLVSPSFFSFKFIDKKLINSCSSAFLTLTNIFYDLETYFDYPHQDQIGPNAIYNLLKLLDINRLFSNLLNQFKKIEPTYFLYKNDYKKLCFQIPIISFNITQKAIRDQKYKNLKKNLKYQKSLLIEKKQELKYIIRNILKSKNRLLKRLRVIKNFLKTSAKPQWMILSVLPILPPGLRAMVQFHAGHLATSDLNDLYKKVINRNNRLKKFKHFLAPEIILQNETRLLQESVDSLIDSNKASKLVLSSITRPLKSLSEILEGKQGRFRQNLLGKRVDYSGRSVIVVDPHLKLHQCGLPKQMAIELFQPFLLQYLLQKGFAHTIKGAKKKIQNQESIVFKILKQILKKHLILLNRAPTLHRLSIQAFEPILIQSRAIKLHPLVCSPFNADFDGDQMAVHVPLSREAQAEARLLMLATNNLLSPASGQPISIPSQDMVLGWYYLTTLNFSAQFFYPNYFSNLKHVLNFFSQNQDKISIHTIIWVRIITNFHSSSKYELPLAVHLNLTGRLQMFYNDNFIYFPSNYKFLRTTVGRILFNQFFQDIFI
uniref:DNA-directed RNA polymerase subunit beta' n=1 Tax=Verdigellas peltata TaxID=542676 RepID=A0A170TPJ2_9VIRI|nr:RNA polymerase beta' subunit [Verdigellas peltata]CZF96684.1 RNA polymerase beta' subunit [Verdigellas peltata]